MRKVRRLALPAYVLLCLLLGGSSQGVWSNAVLQLIAALMLGYVAVARRGNDLSKPGRSLLVIAVAWIAAILMQLVPLPPSLWQSFGGRELVASGQAMLGYVPGWQPLSLSPFSTVQSAFALLPPIAIIAWALKVRDLDETWIAFAIVIGALANVLLGAVQLASAGQASWAYFYRFTSTGAVGFFANRNHMASLLVAAIPFAAVLFASGQERLRGRGRNFAIVAIGGGGFLLILVGIMLNASLAAGALAIPVIAFSALLLPGGWRFRRLVAPLAGIGLVAAVIALGSSSIRNDWATSGAQGSVYSRQAMWSATSDAIAETFPVGTGLGTFSRVYSLRENPAGVNSTYINHAHNDYLELVLEFGLLGIVLIIAGIAWWAVQAVAVWRSPISSTVAKASTIASAALLAHSIVDFPLRSAGLAAVLSLCLGSMVLRSSRKDRAGKARHVTIA